MIIVAGARNCNRAFQQVVGGFQSKQEKTRADQPSAQPVRHSRALTSGALKRAPKPLVARMARGGSGGGSDQNE